MISKAKEKIRHHEDKRTPGPGHRKTLNVTTLTARVADNSKTLTGSLVHLYGSRSRGMGRDLTGARPLLTHNDRPRGRRILNDNYCVDCVAGKTVCVHVTSKVSYTVNCVAGKKDCAHVTGQQNSVVPERDGKKDCLFVAGKKETVTVLPVNSCHVATHVPFANGYPQKKSVNPESGHCQEIKYVNDVFPV